MNKLELITDRLVMYVCGLLFVFSFLLAIFEGRNYVIFSFGCFGFNIDFSMIERFFFKFYIF